MQAQIDEQQPEKRRRTGEAVAEERPPNWERFKDYSQSKYQELESKVQGDDVFFLFNSTELRMVGFQMEPVDPPPAPSPHISRRTRSASSAPERASTEGRRFRLPADVENQGLASLAMWLLECW